MTARSTGSACHGSTPGSCFAKLLGTEDHGSWRIAPKGVERATHRHYRGDTLVLESEFVTDEGTVRIIDCMPIRQQHPEVVRLVEGVRGTVTMEMQLTIRFGYGQVVPWVRRTDGTLTAVAGPDALSLWTTVRTHGSDLSTVAEFTVSEGQTVPFSLSWYPATDAPPRPVDAVYAIADTEQWWEEWVAQCTYDGEYRDAVVRSLITLKALTYEPTGGIVAAATTSLPEALGGGRNWDYRFCWLRDATLDPRVAHAWRLLPGGDGLAELAPAGDGGGPLPDADHVRGRGRAAARRVGGRLAAGLRRIASGPHRQRRGRAVPARRLRRGDVGPLRVGPARTIPTAVRRGSCSAR